MSHAFAGRIQEADEERAEAASKAVDERPPVNIRTTPFHHFCSVLERPLIEKRLHSSVIDVYDPGIKLNGVGRRARLVEVVEVGAGRWVNGGRQPAEVERGQLCYVKENTIPFRMLLRKQNHFYVAMDSIMAEVDPINLKLRPVGDWIVTREVEERARVAVMGDSPFHIGQTPGTGKDGSEADDIGCNKTRFGEVVAVGPGRFGGFIPKLEYDAESTLGFRLVQEPYWQTIDCKVGDLIAFSDMARPTDITLAGKKYTTFEFDHSICAVLA